MAIKIVRQPSDTPNINSIDDYIPLRYAYGNQNGYIGGIGTELEGSYSNGIFTVGSGRAVIQGVEIKIDANSASTPLDTSAGTRYFKIFLKANLRTEIAELVSYYSTTSYDDIEEPVSGELINDQEAYLELYTVQLNGAIEVEKTKKVKAVEYGVTLTQDNNNVLHVGDEIVSKKKLLWSGSFDVTSALISKVADLRVIGKTLEVVTSVYGIERYYKFHTAKVDGFDSTSITFSEPYLAGLILYITELTFEWDETSFYVSSGIQEYGSQMVNQRPLSITKIYEIIE